MKRENQGQEFRLVTGASQPFLGAYFIQTAVPGPASSALEHVALKDKSSGSH